MRMQGYLDALKESSIPFDEELIINCSNEAEENHKILSKVFTDLKPDGVFASVERLAIASYYTCQTLGLSIPDDIKIIGFYSLAIGRASCRERVCHYV